MNTTTEILFELPTVLCIYADSRLERYPVAGHSPAGLDDPTRTASKNIVVEPEAAIRERIYLP